MPASDSVYASPFLMDLFFCRSVYWSFIDWTKTHIPGMGWAKAPYHFQMFVTGVYAVTERRSIFTASSGLIMVHLQPRKCAFVRLLGDTCHVLTCWEENPLKWNIPVQSRILTPVKISFHFGYNCCGKSSFTGWNVGALELGTGNVVYELWS